MKVLILNSSSADIVLFSTPLIRLLKTRAEDVQIFYDTSPEGAAVLRENPYLDRILPCAQGLWRKFRILRKFQVNLIIDLENTISSRLLCGLTGKKVLRLKGLGFSKWLMVKFKIDQLPNTHLTERMVNLLSSFNIGEDHQGLDYYIPFKDQVPLEWLPPGFQNNFVVFCLSVKYETRRLPLLRLIELCDKINKPIILLGFKADVPIAEAIADFFQPHLDPGFENGLRALNKKTRIYNGCGKFNFHQMASVVKSARYVFTFDNVFIPVASAFKKEVYTIWGNTVPAFGRYPYNTKFTILENKRVACRPCSTKGYEKCPLRHFKCMNDIVFDFYLP